MPATAQGGAQDAGIFAAGARLHLAHVRPDSQGEPPPEVEGFQRPGAAREDLPFWVELWDVSKQSVERVLAMTASGNIGYAAYYAATREYPERYLTLRHNDRIVSRWNGLDP